MWIDERKAKEYWCPMSREFNSTAYGNGPANRGHGVTDAMCKGKVCMEWRWGHLTRVATGEDGLTPEEVGANPKKYPGEKFKPRWGYCGLGGKPKD